MSVSPIAIRSYLFVEIVYWLDIVSLHSLFLFRANNEHESNFVNFINLISVKTLFSERQIALADSNNLIKSEISLNKSQKK